MHTVELYAAVRRAVFVEGISRREAARRFGLARMTVHKMLEFSVPPGYRRQKPVHRPKLEPYLGIIQQILRDDTQRPRKQRHTAKRIFERLRAEHGYAGGYTTVKDYVREQRLVQQEMFVPLSHPPGDAQVDFGEAEVIVRGVPQTAHFFVLDLPHSDDGFVMAFPAETTEAFCEGHNQAFVYLGGVPRHILYDNTKIAVARILGDGSRQRTKTFTELQSHYLFTERFGRPGKGNDKGKVEGLVGYARRNFFVPVPRFNSYDELNARLLEQCQQRRERRLRGQQETIGERFERDRQALLLLPATLYEACEQQTTRVTSLSLVRYRGNDYSVPVAYGHRQVLVKGYVQEVVICCGSEVIARHTRSYEREDTVYDPLHYLPLLEHKSNALDQAAPLQSWALPEVFPQLRLLLEARQGKRGKREYVQVLRLLECFAQEVVTSAIQEALRLQAISFDAVKHLVLCRIEHKPAHLNVEQYPHLPIAQVATTASTDYLSLLSEDLVRQTQQTSDEVLHLGWEAFGEPLSEVRN
jgi:transposase